MNPHRAWRLIDGVPEVFIPGAVPWLPRQKLPKAYQLNGAVYVFRAALLAQEAKSLLVGKLGAVLMPRRRSQDIDDSLDFTIVEALLKKSKLMSKSLQQLLSLKGKTAIVTGGAGYLGTAISETLAELGANLVLASRDKAKCEKKCEEIEETTGGAIRAVALELDVLKKDSTREVSSTVCMSTSSHRHPCE